MPRLGDILDSGAARLLAAGVEQPRRDARLLLMAAAGLSAEELIRRPDAPADPVQMTRYMEMITRRQSREPVSRILGRREFWSLEFAITPDTLDPRPDSETLISAALDHVEDRSRAYNILDIGTGSGCLLLALLSELPMARGTGIDISEGALDTARANAQRLGFSRRSNFVNCDICRPRWAQRIGGPYDIVIANPPYISTASLAVLAPEVTRFDPMAALSGGEDGLDFYRIITISLVGLLVSGGLAIIEAGSGQAEAVQTLLTQAGLTELATRQDLGSIPRAITGRMRAESVIED
ncbi:MAG: peptide chain release factor N(5)-glutamine methyltransferase [Alphaproteobacteria bacterium]|nr:peptide chain release factor N(5)-glutamine methyltransferase [Alphaproteobacteria bacterium]